MRLVLIESPFAGVMPEAREANFEYLKQAMRDCLARGEAPFASHALYPLVLDDKVRTERMLGIEAGLAWGAKAEATVVYADRGVSPGMTVGILRAEREGRSVEYRLLGGAEPKADAT